MLENLFPINLNLRGRKCLVVGGGRVAERKVSSLLQCGAEIWIVSPKLTEKLGKLIKEDKINFAGTHYETEHLQDCALAISAVDDTSVNSKVADECFTRNIPVNVVDDPERCSFTVPSVLRRGSLCITVSTDGKSPLLSRRIRETLENSFGPEYAEFLDLMGEIRSRVIRDVPDIEKRRKIFQCLIGSDILELLRQDIEKKEGGGNISHDLRRIIEERVAQCMSS
ncbi:bifunctional precorrin-2 dehydrogenase/sirohydrochlorin ferrochelatase [Candidatus Poribacteria bacterium]